MESRQENTHTHKMSFMHDVTRNVTCHAVSKEL